MAFDPNTLSGILGIAAQDPTQAMGGLGAVSGMGQVPGMAPDNGGMTGALTQPTGGVSGAGIAKSVMSAAMLQALMGAGKGQQQQQAAPSGGARGESRPVKVETKYYAKEQDPNRSMNMSKAIFGG